MARCARCNKLMLFSSEKYCKDCAIQIQIEAKNRRLAEEKRKKEEEAKRNYEEYQQFINRHVQEELDYQDAMFQSKMIQFYLPLFSQAIDAYNRGNLEQAKSLLESVPPKYRNGKHDEFLNEVIRQIQARSSSVVKCQDQIQQTNPEQQFIGPMSPPSQKNNMSSSIKCEICGGVNIQRQNGVFVCQSCGIQYSSEELKQMLSTSTTGTTKPEYNLDSKELPEDSKEAFQFYLSAAQNGDIRGMLKVADAYCYGRGVAKRPESGVLWVTEAANKGDAKAQYILARHFLEGFGTEKNWDMAVYWLESSSRQGNTVANQLLDKIKRKVSKYNGTFYLPIDKWQSFYEKHPAINQRYGFHGFEVGDLLEFGSNGKPIPWVVTQIEGNRFTLLSLYQTDQLPFNESENGDENKDDLSLLSQSGKTRYAWHNSSLREWLNAEYPSAYFKGKEEDALLPTVLHFPAYDDVIKDDSDPQKTTYIFHGSELEDCIDRVFIPRMNSEFYDLCIPRELDGKRLPVVEEIAEEDGDIGDGILSSNDIRETNWWIRLQLADDYCDQNLAYSNRMYSNNRSPYPIPDASTNGGVRPMITLDLDKAAICWNEQEIAGSFSYEEFLKKIIEFRKQREVEKSRRLTEKKEDEEWDYSDDSYEARDYETIDDIARSNGFDIDDDGHWIPRPDW